MARLLMGGFLLVHGFIHLAVYLIPPDPDKPQPFDPRHSWALSAAHVAESPVRSLAQALAISAGAVFMVAALLLFAGSAWLPVAALGAALGLMLKTLYFNPWLVVGVAIDVGFIWAAYAEWPASLV